MPKDNNILNITEKIKNNYKDIGLKNKSKTKTVFYELEEIQVKHDTYDHEEPKN